jgi:hypothetical protein
VKTAQKIDLKRQELDILRTSIARTLGPHKNMQGVGLGLMFAGFALGIMVERWGWRPTIGSALSVNRLAALLVPIAAPALGMLHSQ